jgi:hypothetical protein
VLEERVDLVALLRDADDAVDVAARSLELRRGVAGNLGDLRL